MTKKQTKTKNLTEVVFILDRSGSMDGLETDTIGGFNAMIKKQKEEHTNALISTILFDHESTVLHDRIKADDVPLMTEKDYSTRGTTALLDAIGSTISHISTIQKYARKEDKPTKTLFVITTDGYENASKTYTFEKIRKMIEKQREKEGWEFLFLGADIDAIGAAAKIGIGKDYAANIIKDEEGVGVLFQTVGDTVCCCCMDEHTSPLRADWKKKIEKDYLTRKNKKRV